MARVLDTIRAAIRGSHETPAAIAGRAGIHRSVLSKLLAGRSVTVEVAEKLASALGLRLEVIRKGKSKGR